MPAGMPGIEAGLGRVRSSMYVGSRALFIEPPAPALPPVPPLPPVLEPPPPPSPPDPAVPLEEDDAEEPLLPAFCVSGESPQPTRKPGMIVIVMKAKAY